jgi:ParB family protein of integrating conjugative element (PFGI_1 class)
MSTGSGAEAPPIPLLNVGLELRSLDVSQIKSYEHNPRRAENTEYDRIKASIRREGLGQPLVVTQRPGDAHYVVHAGGNTRLRILKELFAETGDRRFGTVACVCRSWTGEADVLLAHLKENDLRGDLTFVDKARAVAESKRLLEEETGTGVLSQIVDDSSRSEIGGVSQSISGLHCIGTGRRWLSVYGLVGSRANRRSETNPLLCSRREEMAQREG